MAQALAGERSQTSAAQHGIWVTEAAGVAGTAYHLGLTIRFAGDLDLAALHLACLDLVDRHPALRTRVEERDGAMRLSPAPNQPRVRLADLTAIPDGDRDTCRDALLADEITLPFDLRGGPLARFTLVTEAPDRHLLVIVVHHLIFDGSSKDILVRDLAALYQARRDRAAAGLPGLSGPHTTPPPAAEPGPDAAAFWRERWREPDPPPLPGLRSTPRRAEPGEAVTLRVEPALRTGIEQTAAAIGVTAFELLLCALGTLLRRYGDRQPLIAITLSTRTAATADQIGMHVNELPVMPPAAQESFAAQARALRGELREIYRYRDVPLARVVGGLSPRPSLSTVSMSYRRRTVEPSFPGVHATVDWAVFSGAARNALHLQIVHGPDDLELHLQHSPAAIDTAAVTRIAGHLRTLLAGVVADPWLPPAELPLLPEPERDLLLTTWNDTAVTHPGPGTVIDALRDRAVATPDAVAVAGDGTTVSYAALVAMVDRWAHGLRAAGVRPGDRVGVHTGRSPRMLQAVLAIMRAGAAYVPLDPAYPAQRLAVIAADADLRLIVTDRHLPVPAGIPTLDLATLATAEPAGPGAPFPSPHPDALAYTIYTSGSTGRPKGVDIPHRALLNLLHAMGDTLDAGPGDRWLALTSLSFDISALELLLPLVTGGRVVIAPDGSTKDGPGLLRLIRAAGVTHVQATPSGWHLLLAAGLDEPGIVALTGGEPLTAPLAEELRARVGRLVNVYGPTETTIWSSHDEYAGEVTIGRPIANTRAYVLTDGLRPVPVGVPGELHLGGTGLAHGYHRRPGLTADRFRPDPFGPPGGRLYRTGDVVRHTADGRLEFIGRRDNQVKLRGHRIELGEIEARLVTHPLVRQAAVLLREDRLIGYVVGTATVDEMRRHLADALPDHMVPASFVPLAWLPLAPGGKLDRAALPVPAPVIPQPAPAARSGLITAVNRIWCEVMGRADIGPDDDLFDLGGHSLTITQIITRIRRDLHIEVRMDTFFSSPTVAGVVAAIERRAA